MKGLADATIAAADASIAEPNRRVESKRQNAMSSAAATLVRRSVRTAAGMPKRGSTHPVIRTPRIPWARGVACSKYSIGENRDLEKMWGLLSPRKFNIRAASVSPWILNARQVEYEKNKDIDEGDYQQSRRVQFA